MLHVVFPQRGGKNGTRRLSPQRRYIDVVLDHRNLPRRISGGSAAYRLQRNQHGGRLRLAAATDDVGEIDSATNSERPGWGALGIKAHRRRYVGLRATI